MREVGSNPEELLEDLRNKPHTSKERCQLLNQIERFFIETEELIEKRGEIFWRNVLESRSSEERFIAFCHLSVLQNPEQETRLKLKEFKEKKENKEIVDKAQKLIRQLLRETN